MALRYYDEAKHLSPWLMCGVFLKDFYAHTAAVESPIAV